jgi:hypothetical protein
MEKEGRRENKMTQTPSWIKKKKEKTSLYNLYSFFFFAHSFRPFFDTDVGRRRKKRYD